MGGEYAHEVSGKQAALRAVRIIIIEKYLKKIPRVLFLCGSLEENSNDPEGLLNLVELQLRDHRAVQCTLRMKRMSTEGA